MKTFVPGQRWISNAELQLGLGTIKEVDFRVVTVDFPAGGESRTYASETAPLTRVAFAAGDRIEDLEGVSITITSVRESRGILTYFGTTSDGEETILPEQLLNPLISLNTPAERLFSLQLDKAEWFDLRYLTWEHLHQQSASECLGLTGGRTALIPHQLYIAHEVASRFAPRVLLADEVGLGKTIEAGMIIHQQLLSGRASRVLIVVPETLINQWMVEMLRKFNLSFTILDEDRCLDMTPFDDSEDSNDSEADFNPFSDQQLVLCGQQFLTGNTDRLEQAVAAGWDLLVVDEAHHLDWSEQQVSEDYRAIEALAGQIPGLLLLTATPEQLGKSGHFARLRLLDPDRYPSLQQFLDEEQGYKPIADALELLQSPTPLSADGASQIRALIHSDDNIRLLEQLCQDIGDDDARGGLTNHLLDRHGTGRVLFRNTRAAVQGFPQRHVHHYPLALPDDYAEVQREAQPEETVAALVAPDVIWRAYHDDSPDWVDFDPRVNWLIQLIRDHYPHKILLITATAASALDLSTALRVKAGINAAVFHEGLSILERDRAAAWFADPEEGTQILLCSEIGSEGRNFQFAHHLVLFDLPLNPDLLEQRIGRLDRIGQTADIHLHIPVFAGTANERLYRFFQHGLGAFEQTCPAGHAVFSQVRKSLRDQLIADEPAAFDAFLQTTSELTAQALQELQEGRDRLLEFNSCRPGNARTLLAQASTLQASTPLVDYLDRIFDCYNVEFEDDSDTTYIIRPGNHMEDNIIAGLTEDGMKITCDRDTALSNEDLQYFTWEHPAVSGAMQAVVSSEAGNSTLIALKHPGIRPGTVLLECLFILAPATGESSLASRYLPPTIIRVVMDKQGRNVGEKLSHEVIDHHRVNVNRDVAGQVISACAADLKRMVASGEQAIGNLSDQLISEARERAQFQLEEEIHRLQALQRVNSNVRDSEIGYFSDQLASVLAMLDQARPRLDALRVMVAA